MFVSKANGGNKHQASKKGHRHTKNPTSKSKAGAVSPAVYRNTHKGVTKKKKTS